MKLYKWHILLMVIFFSGCVSQIPSLDEYTKSGIGQPVDGLRESAARPYSYASRTGWKETTYRLDNGNWVYIESAKIARKDIYIHWEVNPQGIIIGSTVEKTSSPPGQ